MKKFQFLAALLLGCTQAPSAPVAAPPSPHRALEALDTRKALPLLPMMANHQKQNMREHLVAVQEIVAALASDDFAAVEKAAARIGFSEQMGMMCNHLGAGGPGFTEQALAFHHQADRIGDAARAKDKTQVQAELGKTLELCTGCHATWKQEIVDDAEWQKRTATAPPAPH